MLGRCFETIIKFDFGDSNVRLRPGAGSDTYHRAWIFNAHADHPAWPVILKTATDQLDAVRQQCRRQGVSLVGRILAPVKLEADRLVAIQAAAERIAI